MLCGDTKARGNNLSCLASCGRLGSAGGVFPSFITALRNTLPNFAMVRRAHGPDHMLAA